MTPAQKFLNRRKVRDAADRSRGALDNLHVNLCHLAERARKAGGEAMAKSLVEASQTLDAAITALVLMSAVAEQQERNELQAARDARVAARKMKSS